MTIPFTHILFLAILLFAMGAACAMTRKNLFMILIGVEVMLNAAGIAFVAAAMRWQDMNGQIMALFVMTVAAAEIAVALALIVCIQRRTRYTNVDHCSMLKG